MIPPLVSMYTRTYIHMHMHYYCFKFFSDEDSWNDVIIACSSLAAKWQQMSGFMGLPLKTIRKIRDSYPNDSATSWNKALMQWILQEYNTQKHGLPSWKLLLKAISRVDQPLFEKLAKEHQLKGILCRQTEASPTLITPTRKSLCMV